MSKIIRCDCDEVLAELPNVINYAYERFGDKNLTAYCVLDKDNLSFILRNENNCIYLKNKDEKLESYLFTISDRGLEVILYDKYHIYLNDDLLFVDSDNNNQLCIEMLKREVPDNDGYDGVVSFRQYNPNLDVSVEMQYQKMYRVDNGIASIYQCNLNNLDYVFIDKKASRRKPVTLGPVLGREYYCRYDLNNDSVGYQQQRMKEILVNGQSIEERKKVKYYSIKFITPSGNYVTGFPFGYDYDEEDIYNIIRKYNVETKVPDVLLDVYNNKLGIVKELKELAQQINEVEKNNRDDMKLMFIANN